MSTALMIFPAGYKCKFYSFIKTTGITGIGLPGNTFYKGALCLVSQNGSNSPGGEWIKRCYSRTTWVRRNNWYQWLDENGNNL